MSALRACQLRSPVRHPQNSARSDLHPIGRAGGKLIPKQRNQVQARTRACTFNRFAPPVCPRVEVIGFANVPENAKIPIAALETMLRLPCS